MRTFHDELCDMNGYTVQHNLPVIVATLQGVKTFPSLAAAWKEYPTLDPFTNGSEFTWASNDRGRMRFESWELNERLRD
jgi:hypothetical protein